VKATEITTGRPGRKGLVSLFVAALTVLASAILISAPPAAAADWQKWQLDGDRCFDAATRDANGNGTVEQLWFDLDNDCRWDTHLYSTLGPDRFLNAVTFDMNENGVPEYLMRDINQRPGFEWLYLDLNQDRVYELRRIIPGSDLDLTTRANTNNANSTIIHQFRMRTGASLLHPIFPSP
jgi:hypothetical protein